MGQWLMKYVVSLAISTFLDRGSNVKYVVGRRFAFPFLNKSHQRYFDTKDWTNQARFYFYLEESLKMNH